MDDMATPVTVSEHIKTCSQCQKAERDIEEWCTITGPMSVAEEDH